MPKQKELLSLSPVRIEPGRVELGRNRPANAAMVAAACLLALGAATALLGDRMLLGAGMAVAAALLELDRRWINRCHLLIEHGSVRYAPLRGRTVIRFRQAEPEVDVYSYPASDGGGTHHSARLRFAHPAVPDILIQDRLRVTDDERAELERSRRFVDAVRAAWGAAPTTAPPVSLSAR